MPEDKLFSETVRFPSLDEDGKDSILRLDVHESFEDDFEHAACGSIRLRSEADSAEIIVVSSDIPKIIKALKNFRAALNKLEDF